MGVNAIALAWGFAEATLFFIVPDVWLSATAIRRGLHRALLACTYATAGAVAGGAVMYAWGVQDLQAATQALEMIPAISAELVARVRQQMQDYGAWSLFAGPFTGTPYKIYALRAAESGIGLFTFALLSIPARLIRFVAVSALAHFIAETLFRNGSRRRKLMALMIFWLVFYGFYFSLMPN